MNGEELANVFCVKRTYRKSCRKGKAIDVATVAVRPCVTLLSSIRRDQKAYFVSGFANVAIVRHKF